MTTYFLTAASLITQVLDHLQVTIKFLIKPPWFLGVCTGVRVRQGGLAILFLQLRIFMTNVSDKHRYLCLSNTCTQRNLIIFLYKQALLVYLFFISIITIIFTVTQSSFTLSFEFSHLISLEVLLTLFLTFLLFIPYFLPISTMVDQTSIIFYLDYCPGLNNSSASSKQFYNLLPD